MQLYAFDLQQNLISATKALKTQNYTCIECQGILRVRKGIHRHPHFFHLAATPSCKLSLKSMTHIQIQSYLQTILPWGESYLEMRFPQINRIADVAWPAKKLIFEVQCSFMSAEEMQARVTAYASLGYQVVWILHDKQFNQRRLSGMELKLCAIPHYFTDIDAEGKGKIYDQFEQFKRGYRIFKSPPLPVDVSQKLFFSDELTKKLPRILEKRTKWPFYFKGDLIDHIEQDSFSILHGLDIHPSVHKTCFSLLKTWTRQFILRPYQLLFQLLLEKACK